MKPKISHYNKKPQSDKRLSVETEEKAGFQISNAYYVIGGFLVFVILFSVSYLNYLKKPASQEGDYKYFQIERGLSTYTIGKQLKKEKLVRSPIAFYVFAKTSGKVVQAGYYKVSPKMNLGEIINKFVNGEVDAFSVTIPEGYRVLQIAKLLQQEGKVDANAFVGSAAGTEGTLFPDTYVFPHNLEPAKIVRMMKENFEKRTEHFGLDEEDLILASIVEREALNDQERAKIAAVYKNRIDKNMLLQADPTIRYALDSQEFLAKDSVDFDFWKPITKEDYQNTRSAFNTYLQRGLPPAPICNPGLKSIEATLNPEKDFGYLFFFHDANRNIQFSNTYEEHLQKIQEFGVSG
jgi:UPF0755 protein